MLHLIWFLKLILCISLSNDVMLFNVNDYVLVMKMIMKISYCIMMLFADKHFVFNLVTDYVIICIVHEFSSCSALQLILWDSTDFHFKYTQFEFKQICMIENVVLHKCFSYNHTLLSFSSCCEMCMCLVLACCSLSCWIMLLSINNISVFFSLITVLFLTLTHLIKTLVCWSHSCSIQHIFTDICHVWLMSTSFYLSCQAEQDDLFIDDSTCAECCVLDMSFLSSFLPWDFSDCVSIILMLDHFRRHFR